MLFIVVCGCLLFTVVVDCMLFVVVRLVNDHNHDYNNNNDYNSP